MKLELLSAHLLYKGDLSHNNWLRTGQFINAKVLAVDKNMVQLRIEGQVLNVQLTSDLDDIIPGKTILLQVEELQEDKVSLKRVLTNTDLTANLKEDIFQKIGVKNNEVNKVILRFLMQHGIEATAQKFFQIEEAIKKLGENNEKAVLAAVVASKMQLSHSNEANRALFSLFDKGIQFLNILEKVELWINSVLVKANPKAAEDLLSLISLVKETFSLKGNNNIIQLVKNILTTPEKILSSDSQQLSIEQRKEIDNNLLVKIDLMIKGLNEATKGRSNEFQEAQSALEQVKLLKQIVLGNVLISDMEHIQYHTVIPFYYNSHRGYLKIFKRKQKQTKKEADDGVRLELAIDHNKIGKVKLKLHVKHQQVFAEIGLETKLGKELVESKISLLADRLYVLGYSLIVSDINLLNDSKVNNEGLHEITSFDAINYPGIDITI
ncbi:MAG: hypothetical protein SCK28_14915 [Bacillota bacterium]|nr:hypothetical protein [Bacillota bacterium]